MPDLSEQPTEQLVARERELFSLVNRAGAAKADVLEYHAIEDELGSRDDHDPVAGAIACRFGDADDETLAQQEWP